MADSGKLTRPPRDLLRIALFGLIDGLNGMAGLVIGLLRDRTAASVIFVAVLAVSGANAVSMAGAQYESDDDRTLFARWLRVTAMGGGYLVSALLPGLGFAVNRSTGIIIFIPLTVFLLAGITWFRSGSAGWARAAVTTLVIFVLAVGAGLLAPLAG